MITVGGEGATSCSIVGYVICYRTTEFSLGMILRCLKSCIRCFKFDTKSILYKLAYSFYC